MNVGDIPVQQLRDQWEPNDLDAKRLVRLELAIMLAHTRLQVPKVRRYRSRRIQLLCNIAELAQRTAHIQPSARRKSDLPHYYGLQDDYKILP